MRRRLGGANATVTVTPAKLNTSTPTATVTRRPFRIASRRRPSSTTTVKASTTTTTEATTVRIASEESLQDISDADYIEDPSLKPRTAAKTPKLQRRPLVILKDEEIKDQNPSATNEEEKKRQSKKYSSTFKQNQLDEMLKRTKSQEELDITTEGKDITTEGKTTVEVYDAETAVAIAAHQLLAAPIPITQNFDENTKPARKSLPTTTEFRYTKTDYTDSYIDSKKPNEYSSTPIYKTSTDYITSPGVYTGIATDFTKTPLSYNPEPTGFSKSAAFKTDPTIFAKTTAFAPDSTVFGRSTSGYNSATTTLSKSISNYVPETSGFTKPTSRYSDPIGFTKSSYGPETSTYTGFTSRPSFPSTLLSRPSTLNPDVSVSPGGGSSTAKYLSTSDKYITLPVEDFGYSSSSQDPSYFTREYLLESPVTKTYDEEYQYLSPVTKQQTTTRRSPQKKTVSRKISTTIKPTTPLYVVAVTTPKPRRVPSKKPFEKIPVQKSTYRPIENYDYYDDGAEKLAEKYAEGTKVVLHSKGTIECLDIGNFPHPTSCKKFISCARIENGSLLGWEYICPKGLSFDPVGGICNWSAGLGCDEKDV